MVKKLVLSAVLAMGLASTTMAKNTSNVNNTNTIKEKVKEAFGEQLKQYRGVTFKILDIMKDKDLGNNIYVGTNIVNFNGRKNVGMFFAFDTKKHGVVVLPITSNTLLFNKKNIYIDAALVKEATISVKKKNEIKKQEQQKLTDNFLKYFNKKDAAIVLSKGHKKSIVIITDPNCPFCAQKMQDTKGLKKLADKYNIVVILAPIVEYDKNNNIIKNRSLHPNSPYYAAAILTHLKNNMTFDEKMKVLKKYFKPVPRNDKNVKNLKYNKKYLKTMENNSKKYYYKIGVEGTPTFIILDNNETKELFNKLK